MTQGEGPSDASRAGCLETPGGSPGLPLHHAGCGESWPDMLLFQTQPSTHLDSPNHLRVCNIPSPPHQPYLVGWALCNYSLFSLKCSSQRYTKLTSSLPSGPGDCYHRDFPWTHKVNLSASIFSTPLIPSFFILAFIANCFPLFSCSFSFFPSFFASTVPSSLPLSHYYYYLSPLECWLNEVMTFPVSFFIISQHLGFSTSPPIDFLNEQTNEWMGNESSHYYISFKI